MSSTLTLHDEWCRVICNLNLLALKCLDWIWAAYTWAGHIRSRSLCTGSLWRWNWSNADRYIGWSRICWELVLLPCWLRILVYFCLPVWKLGYVLLPVSNKHETATLSFCSHLLLSWAVKLKDEPFCIPDLQSPTVVSTKWVRSTKFNTSAI